VFAVGMSLSGLWMLRFDMARKALKKKGLHQYSAVILLVGFIWLILTGFLFWFANRLPFGYDASLHGFFLGFVFSMIFAHAPIILPGVLKFNFKSYHPSLYVWFGLMQISLLVRISTNFWVWQELRLWVGLINGIAIVGFFIHIIIISLVCIIFVKKQIEDDPMAFVK
jgi:hypothetical protein